MKRSIFNLNYSNILLHISYMYVLNGLLLLSNTKISVSSLVCPYNNIKGGNILNITCPDSCCEGFITSASQACCRTASNYWNSSVYVGLSVPVLCFMITLLGGITYCCMIIKPTRRNNQIGQTRTLSTISDDSYTQTNGINKDSPPGYNELFKSFQANSGNNASKKDEGNTIRSCTINACHFLQQQQQQQHQTQQQAVKEDENSESDEISRNDSPYPPPYQQYRSENVHIV